MATTEHTINDALAACLRSGRHAWRPVGVVTSENTGMLKGNSRRPDIAIIEPNTSPVIVETEVLPAITVEVEARSRLGEQLRVGGQTILSSVAVRLPARLRDRHGAALEPELRAAADLEFALYLGRAPEAAVRWPSAGWIVGSVQDLTLIAQVASLPPDLVKQAADELEAGVREAADLLADVAKAHPTATRKVAKELRQEDGEQTRRMAATILANALVFQETLAGGPGDLEEVSSLEQVRGREGALTRSAVLEEWRRILEVNYWPIFDIARRILEIIPADGVGEVLDRLGKVAGRLMEKGVMRSHDVTGAVFQRLIADRKFLAAYYTTPASAALLVGLALSREATPPGGAWGDAATLKALRIADFACGTGTLLSTAYQRLGQLHEMEGGDAEALHSAMMESVFVGCDVLPAATHLTGSMLSGAHPRQTYADSQIMTLPYGPQPRNTVALGSLDLLANQGLFDILAPKARGMGGKREKARDTWRELRPASFDLVIMNPPFTRPTGQEGKKIGVHNPMFAAFAFGDKDQRLMGKAIEKLTRGTMAHGNAGEASIFLMVADRMLKPNGTLALVMPLSVLSGEAWEGCRKHLAKYYSDFVLVSISGDGDEDSSFSADTGMAECLIVARKQPTKNPRGVFAVLAERPATALLSVIAAEQVHRLVKAGGVSKLEQAPVGGTAIKFGADVIGYAVDAGLPSDGPWNPTRVFDLALAQAAYQLTAGHRLWLPGMPATPATMLPMGTVTSIGGTIGPYHADINGKTQAGGFRGPFDVVPADPRRVPTYPVLWSHDAERERTMSFEADSEGVPRTADSPARQSEVDAKVAAVQASASHCHFNQNFRFNSQSTAMQYTNRPTIGGRAWTSIQLYSAARSKALVAWANSSLGILVHWYHANKQQAGRGNVVPTSLAKLPVLDVTALSGDQLKAAQGVFNALCTKPLRPVNEIDRDPVRALLDKRFCCEVLGLPESVADEGGPLDLLRRKLAREPSIRGKKSSQPAEAEDD